MDFAWVEVSAASTTGYGVFVFEESHWGLVAVGEICPVLAYRSTVAGVGKGRTMKKRPTVGETTGRGLNILVGV